jgi:hypothetical protein
MKGIATAAFVVSAIAVMLIIKISLTPHHYEPSKVSTDPQRRATAEQYCSQLGYATGQAAWSSCVDYMLTP